jgi:sugar phosphate isomerase/epimerase
MLADKIIHIHASDNDGVEDQHFGIGQGKINYEWFAETIKKMGYDKSVIIESITNVTQSIQKLTQLLA